MPYASREILRERLKQALSHWAKTSGFPPEVVFEEIAEIERQSLKNLSEMEGD